MKTNLDSFAWVYIAIREKDCDVSIEVKVEGIYCKNKMDWDWEAILVPETSNGELISFMIAKYLDIKENWKNVISDFEKNATIRS